MTGRRVECGVLDQLIGAVRAGESRALLLHGEPGVGKTALLEYLAVQALGCRVVRAAGVESEMELAFAGLHQLCAPLLDRLEHLPVPQRDALRTAFGLSEGPAPQRFLVGLAVLGLLSEGAEQRPLMCLVDDQQWLDRASAQALAFVARRLGAESIGLVFAARGVGPDLAGVPELAVEGLRETDAQALLDVVLSGPIDVRVREQIVLEARGNPLALMELSQGFAPLDLAGGFGLPGMKPLSGSIEDKFSRQIGALPQQTRRLLQIAAADPSGNPALVWRAAERMGIRGDAAAPAADAGLAEIGTRVRFRHPLARSAAYRSASARDRQEVHRVLAEVTDQDLDPDRHAWHRAQAAPGPHQAIAAELERSAGRAQARGGPAAAAAFLRQAATLTPDPVQRAKRALDAARAAVQAGALGSARDLLAMARSGPLSDFEQASVDLLRAQLAFITSRGGEAPALLVKAAKRLEPIDADLSRATYLDALAAAIFAAHLAAPGGDVADVAAAASMAPPPRHTPRAIDLFLDGTAAALHHDYAAGVPMLRDALAAVGTRMPVDEELRLMWLANITANRLWDADRWEQLSARHLQLARDTGALSELPLALTTRACCMLFTGEHSAAESMIHELQAVQDATGSGLVPYVAMGLAAYRSDEARAAALIEATYEDAARRGEGVGIVFADWATTALNNGLGRYDQAVTAGRHALAYDKDAAALNFVLPEVMEAAARGGMPEVAADAYDRIAVMARASGTDWVLGLEARSHALLSEGARAERLFAEAIGRFGRTRLRLELARTHLLYGEWLRQERRGSEARDQLRTAHGMLEAMGVTAFAERAGRELRAAGGTVHKRITPARNEELTAQEGQIARMAGDGLSNQEIGARLFISARTVQYHLRKVFAKLGITSRSQLDRVLPGGTNI
ncbi:AAA family ATPase [Streptomyces sp. Lzd4kr]|nr:AAA family ATPase [Streptomyces sp. Lzd4kr]